MMGNVIVLKEADTSGPPKRSSEIGPSAGNDRPCSPAAIGGTRAGGFLLVVIRDYGVGVAGVRVNSHFEC